MRAARALAVVLVPHDDAALTVCLDGAGDLGHRLAGGAELLAVDLRGRGRSHTSTGPFGIRRHAADIVRIVGQLGRFRSQIQNTGTTGSVSITVDLTSIPVTPVVAMASSKPASSDQRSEPITL